MSTLKEKAEAILQEKETKIIPENFSENLEVLGVQGELPEGDYYGGAFASSIEVRNDMVTFYGGTGEKQIVGAENVAVIGFSNDSVAEAINLTAGKIKKDEVILGITGTYEGSGAWSGIYLANNGFYYNTNIENLEIHTTDDKFNVKVERVLKCEDGMPDASVSLKVQVLDSQLHNKLLENVAVSCDILDENRNLIYNIYSDNFNTLDYSKGNTWSNYVYISNASGYFPLDGFDKARYIDNFAITYTVSN